MKLADIQWISGYDYHQVVGHNIRVYHYGVGDTAKYYVTATKGQTGTNKENVDRFHIPGRGRKSKIEAMKIVCQLIASNEYKESKLAAYQSKFRI